jgi:hypothetical protein
MIGPLEGYKMDGTESPDKHKRATHRSPSYPMFSLAQAIDKARVIYDNCKRSYTTPDAIAKLLGFSQHIGGPGGRTMSALRQYGLLEESGGKSRISDRAYTLTQFPSDSPERIQAIKAAIREPSLFRELLTEFSDGVSDTILNSNLLRRGFNPDVISDVIRVFRETIALDESHNVEYHPIQVGDYVQWESQGALCFDKPKRINRLSDDGKFAFFDGSNSGVPVEQLIKESAPEMEDGGKPEIKKAPPKPGMKSEVFTLDEGEVVLQWPSTMSAESYEDFKDWLDLIIRKAKRAADKKESGEPPSS